MPANISILNWNVQNYGDTKCGNISGNTDLGTAIAKVVVKADVDIFVLLELNTTKPLVARQICHDLCQELNAADPVYNNWTCVLSPNTGKEFYAFFVRDNTYTVPQPLTGVNNGAGIVAATTATTSGVGGATPPIQNLTFGPATYTGGSSVANESFILMEPDKPAVGAMGYKKKSPPQWPATRKPGLGLFKVIPKAGPPLTLGNDIVPIVACHYSPSNIVAQQQLDKFMYFELFYQLRATPGATLAPVPLQFSVGGVGSACAPQTPLSIIVTGDFNINYSDTKLHNSYREILAPGPNIPAWGGDYLGAVPQIPTGTNTFLVTLLGYAFNPRYYNSTSKLAIKNFDNFFVRTTAPVAPAAGNAWTLSPGGGLAAPEVLNVPELLRGPKRLRVDVSVKLYASGTKRGFKYMSPYAGIYKNMVEQLAGDSSIIVSTEAALLGGRLISDHLPVKMSMQIT